MDQYIFDIIVRTAADSQAFVQMEKQAQQTGKKMESYFSDSFLKIGDIFKALVAFRIARFTLDMFTDVITNSIKFERDLKTILAVSGGGNEGSLRKVVLEDMKDIPFSIFKLTESLEVLTKAGYSSSEAISITTSASNLAVGANEDLNKTVMLVTDTLTAYDLAVDQAGHVTDIFARATVVSKLGIENLNTSMRQVAPLAGVVGASLEDTLAILSALADFGVRGGKGGSTLRQFFQGLLDITPEASARMRELGMSVQFVQDHLDEPIVLMEMLAKTTFSAQDAILIFGKHFGGYISKLVDQFREGTKNANDFKQEILDNAEASQKMADVVGGSTSVAVDKLKAAWERSSVSDTGFIRGLADATRMLLESDEAINKVTGDLDKLTLAFIRIYGTFKEDEEVLKRTRDRLRLQEQETKAWEAQVDKIASIRKILEDNELDAENKRALALETATSNHEKYIRMLREKEDAERAYWSRLLAELEEIKAWREWQSKYDSAEPITLATTTQFVSNRESFVDALKMNDAREGAKNARELQSAIIELADAYDVSAVEMYAAIEEMSLATGQTFETVLKHMQVEIEIFKSVLLGLSSGIAAFFSTLVTDSQNAGKAFAAAFTGTIGQALIASGTAMLLTLNPVTMAQGAAMIAAGGTLVGLSQLMRSSMSASNTSKGPYSTPTTNISSSRSFEVTGVERGEDRGRNIVINVNTERPLATQREITESVLEALRYGKNHGLRLA